MAESVRLEFLDAIAILTLDQEQSRANVLSAALWTELGEAFQSLQTEKNVNSLIVQSGKPGMFIAGADLHTLYQGMQQDPNQVRRLIEQGHRVLGQLEALPMVTLALVDGVCLGGGLEVALACDAVLAGTHPRCELGLPELKLGLIPGWGGTQRLPRRIGLAAALPMLISGQSLKPGQAEAVGLVAGVVPSQDLFAHGLEQLRNPTQIDTWQAIRSTKQVPLVIEDAELTQQLAQQRAPWSDTTPQHQPALVRLLEVIEQGARLPLAAALAVEQQAFLDLAATPQARHLVGNFFQRQRLQKDSGVDLVPPPAPSKVRSVLILGAGLMGTGIATALLAQGISVTVFDPRVEAIKPLSQRVGETLDKQVRRGKLTAEQHAQALAQLQPTTSLEEIHLGQVDLVIEAVTENLHVKQAVLARLHSQLPPRAIVASNTSTLSISQLAEQVQQPAQFAGFHFYNPVERMPLVEVIRGAKTKDATVVSLVALAKQLGKLPIVLRDGPGFLVNRILFMYLDEACWLAEQGAEVAAVDEQAVRFGMPMGPLQLCDVIGLDICLAALEVLRAAYPERMSPARLIDGLVASGQLGQKSQAGIYPVDEGNTQVLAERRKLHQVRRFDAEEVTDRLFLPMLTEACRIVHEGIVRQPADVDMGLILGTGFPAFRGGILAWGRDQGPEALRQRLGRYQNLGPRFDPAPLAGVIS